MSASAARGTQPSSGPLRDFPEGTKMPRHLTRGLLLASMALFLPLFYFGGVIGGVLTYAAIVILTARVPGLLMLNAIQLAIYGFLLYLLASGLTRRIERLPRRRQLFAAATLVAALAGIGLLPVFGIAHGSIRFTDIYSLMASGKLR